MDAVKGASRRASLPLLLPALLFLILLFLYPFAYGLYLSLTTAKGQPSLDNYLRFLNDPRDLRTIWVTLSDRRADHGDQRRTRRPLRLLHATRYAR